MHMCNTHLPWNVFILLKFPWFTYNTCLHTKFVDNWLLKCECIAGSLNCRRMSYPKLWTQENTNNADNDNNIDIQA
jgi:hypothetical protein